ncbi:MULTISPECIES: DUF5689 domain-containing protein [Flavobacterium]|uniref:DUF5689 domain-containing protein n=1 Tax=Flavobacterium hankyongi TaxID=1176532 RepID=A0ABP8ZP99_9FLAO|nr:DUF5689 domain-containing protein [Flavobacterium sp. N1846]
MKNIFIKPILLVVFAAGIITSCVKEDFDEPTNPLKTYEMTPTKTVEDINAAATTTPTEYTGNDIIEAYVTSSDKNGNFYKTVSFQTIPTTGNPVGFSIPIDDVSLFIEGFNPGRKVYIKLEGLYIAKVFGSMQIGYPFEGSIGRIPVNKWRDHLFPSATVVSEDSMTRTLTLDAAYTDANQNTLIDLEPVQFNDGSINRTYYDVDSGGGATNHLLVATNGGTGISRIIRFSSFAPFTGNTVPFGSGKIRGVLSKYNSDFQFMVRYETDIRLTQERVIPHGTLPFNETFTTDWNNWSKVSVLGAQNWTLNASNGNPGRCADMNGFSGGAKENDDWLISPILDFSSLTTATLNFDSARPFSGNALEVYVSTNYLAGLPSTATWTKITANVATGTAWLNSGNISLNSYAGKNNVRIAFRYTSTNTAAAQWRVDNVKVN